MASRAVRLPLPSESLRNASAFKCHTSKALKHEFFHPNLQVSDRHWALKAGAPLRGRLSCRQQLLTWPLQAQNASTRAFSKSTSKEYPQKEGNLEESSGRQFDSTFEGLLESQIVFGPGTFVPRSIGCSLSEREAAKRWTDPGYAYRPLSRGRTAQASNLRTPSKASLSGSLNDGLEESFEGALGRGSVLGSATKALTRPQASNSKRCLERSQSGIHEKVLSEWKDSQIAPNSSNDKGISRAKSEGHASLVSMSIRGSSQESDVEEKGSQRQAAFVSTAKRPSFQSSNVLLTGREPLQRAPRSEFVASDRGLRSYLELDHSPSRTVDDGCSACPSTSYGRRENVQASPRKQTLYGARLGSSSRVKQREARELLTERKTREDHAASQFRRSSEQRRSKIESQKVRGDSFGGGDQETLSSKTQWLAEQSHLEEPGKREGQMVSFRYGNAQPGTDLRWESKADKRVEQLRGGLGVQDEQLGGSKSTVAGRERGSEKQAPTELQVESSSLDDAMGLFVKGMGASQEVTESDLNSKHRQSKERVSRAANKAKEDSKEGSLQEGSVRGFVRSAGAMDSATRGTFVGEEKQLRSKQGAAQDGFATFSDSFSPRRSDLAQPPPSEPSKAQDPSSDVTSTSAEAEELPETAFYDENFLTRFQYTRPPPNRNLPLFLDVRKSGTAPEQPMPPAWQPKRSSHEGSGPLPGYPLGRVPRPKPPGPLVNNKPPEFWVVNPRSNKLVVPWATRESPRGIAPGIKKVVKSWAERGPITREDSLGVPLTNEEAARLIESCVHNEREVYLGRDGLTWNMVRLIHTHWRRRPVCKVKCKGIYTVDMAKLMRDLEATTGGQVIWRQGGTVLLFRGRNFDWKDPPILAPPEERRATKERTQECHPIAVRNPAGIGKLESLQLKKRMIKETPLVWLDKNGYYGGLVHQIREHFRELTSHLAVVKCPGFVYGDIVRLAAQLKDLVPASVFYLDKDRKQQIVLYREAGWHYVEDALSEVAKIDARPTYYPKGPPPRQKRARDYLEEEVLREIEDAGEEWSSWGSVFSGPSAEVRLHGRQL